MKKYCLTIILLFASYFTQAQIVNIPDANFKDALVNYPVADLGNSIIEDVDTNDDGEIQVVEAEAVIKLYVSYFNINSIGGIQSFVNIELLDCAYNNLTSIAITNLISLEFLTCRNNLMDSLDVTQNLNIDYIDCSNNPLFNINVSNNLELKTLFCSNCQLSSLDITQNQNLELLQCSENLFTSLNVSQNPNLFFLSVVNCLLLELDVSQNVNLETLLCHINQLPSLDLTYNSSLEMLNCSNNQIVSLDLSQNNYLFSLYCGINQLESLNLRSGSNEILGDLYAQDNPSLICIQVDNVDFANNQQNWHKDPWAIYSEDCTLGIEDVELNEIYVYPNPTQNILHIETQGQQIETIKIINLQGVIVNEIKGADTVDVSHLASGLYFVAVSLEGHTFTQKFIKL